MRPLKIKTSYNVRFNPDGKYCLAIGRDVNLWDIQVRKRLWKSHPFSHPSYVDFSPDGSLVGVKSTSGQIVTLDTKSGGPIRDFENQREGEGSNLLFSNCGEYFVDGSWDGLLTVRSVSSGQIQYQREFKGEMIASIHSILDGGTWITEHHPKTTTFDNPPDDCYFLKWSWPIGDSEPERLSTALPFIRAASFDRLGNVYAVVSGAPPNELRVYEMQSHQVIWSADLSIGGSGDAVSWSSCGRFLGAVQESRIVIYDGSTGELITHRTLPYPSDVAFSPDSRLVAYGSWQAGEVCLLEPENKPDLDA